MRRFLFALLGAGLLGAGVMVGWRWVGARPTPGPATANPIAGIPAAALEPVPCYFPGRAGMELVEETRQRARGASPVDRLRGAMAELHRGPATAAALPVFPPGLTPRSVFLTPEGVAYLDEPAAAWDRPVGVREEMLLVRAIARTVLRHCPEARALVFLTDGAPRVRLALHGPAQGKYLLPRLRRTP